MKAAGFSTTELRGVALRGDPAREDCFTVALTGEDMVEWADMSPIARRERLHRHMNNECGALEIAAQCLVDFPDAPWDLRMRIARQAADEARHTGLLYRRLVELEGHKGEFPVSNFEWAVTLMLDDLPGRLAVENRTFEAGLIDLLGSLRDVWREAGDDMTADLLDGILADEITHVRFANRWIRRLTEDDPRVLLDVAKAVAFLGKALRAAEVGDGATNAVGVIIGAKLPPAINVEGRLEAEFTVDEVKDVLRKAGFRSIIPHALPAEAES